MVIIHCYFNYKGPFSIAVKVAECTPPEYSTWKPCLWLHPWRSSSRLHVLGFRVKDGENSWPQRILPAKIGTWFDMWEDQHFFRGWIVVRPWPGDKTQCHNIDTFHLGMIDTSHKNGDDLGMAYDIGWIPHWPLRSCLMKLTRVASKANVVKDSWFLSNKTHQ